MFYATPVAKITKIMIIKTALLYHSKTTSDPLGSLVGDILGN